MDPANRRPELPVELRQTAQARGDRDPVHQEAGDHRQAQAAGDDLTPTVPHDAGDRAEPQEHHYRPEQRLVD